MELAAQPPAAHSAEGSMFGTFKIQTPLPEGTAVPPAPQAPAGEGLRFDTDKVRYDLLPADALHALAEHYTRGAAKYAERNWEKGMAWTRCFGPLMRHAWAWMRGEDFDPETATHHMIAVAWNALALYCYAVRNVGKDDRPNSGPPSGKLTPLAEKAASLLGVKIQEATPLERRLTEGEAYVITTGTCPIPFVVVYYNNHFAEWGHEHNRTKHHPVSLATIHRALGKLDVG